MTSRALFRREGDHVLPLPMAEGPWMPGALSGSAVGPLVAALLEGVPMTAPMTFARLSIEFLRPVPMALLEPVLSVVREGRKQQVLRLELRAEGKEVIHATAVRLRLDGVPVASPPAPAFQPPSGLRFDPRVGGDNGFMELLDSRVLRTNDFGPGTSEAWLRYRGEVLEGEAVTPFVRAAMFADFGNGLAPIVDPAHFMYMNADITLHLARPPRGEWMHLQARTVDGGAGVAMVGVELADADGHVGWAHQSLLLERRPG